MLHTGIYSTCLTCICIHVLQNQSVPSDIHRSVTIATSSSGLGTSLASSWDQEHLIDTIVNYHPHNVDQSTPAKVQRSGLYGSGYSMRPLLGSMGESIDLYREKDEDETDSEYDGEDFDT